MSRAEELRKKFREKGENNIATANSDSFLFRDEVEKFVNDKYDASANDELFQEKLYKEFLRERPGSSVQEWLDGRLAGLFVALNRRPRWVDERDWCYEDGIPLKFVNQFSGDDEIEFYVFTGGDEVPFYKMIAQSREGKIELTGIIS